MIYTSYVGNRKLIGVHLCVLISNIQLGVEYWDRDLTLAPDFQKVSALKKGSISWEDFKKAYLLKLQRYWTPEELHNKYDGKILLCCEKDYTHCHRSILLEWLNTGGVLAEEL